MISCRTSVYIEIERDEDGDIIVALHGIPNWHIAMHGVTLAEALVRLGDVVGMAEMEQPDAVPEALGAE